MIKPQILWRTPFFSFFLSSSLNLWVWIEIRTIESCRDPPPPPPPPPGKDRALVRKLCPKSRQPARSPAVQFGMKSYFWSSHPNLRVKLFYTSQILLVQPLPRSRYSGALPGCKIDQSCMSITRRQKMLLKTPHISIEKYVKWHVNNCQHMFRSYLSTLPISSGDSRFRRFLPISRSQQKISRYHDLAQDFLNLKINQLFEKLFNFVCEYSFFWKGKNTLRALLPLIWYFSRVLIWKLMSDLAFT